MDYSAWMMDRVQAAGDLLVAAFDSFMNKATAGIKMLGGAAWEKAGNFHMSEVTSLVRGVGESFQPTPTPSVKADPSPQVDKSPTAGVKLSAASQEKAAAAISGMFSSDMMGGISCEDFGTQTFNAQEMCASYSAPKSNFMQQQQQSQSMMLSR